MDKPKRAKKWRFYALILVTYTVLVGAYWLAAGRLPPVHIILFMPIPWLITRWVIAREQPAESDFVPLEPEWSADIAARLDQEGIHGFELLRPRAGLPIDYPIPFVSPKMLIFGPRPLAELSRPALEWITLAEARAEDHEPQFKVLWMLPYAGLVGFLAGLANRFPNLTWTFLVFLCVVTFSLPVLWIRHLLMAQVESDKHLVRTTGDLAAAKEALGFAYFSMLDRRWWNKEPLLQGQSLRRARAMGIELERGFATIETT